MINESFECENCGKNVSKSAYTARDHCPFCLYSKHVDINPGDRNNKCLGLLKPIGIEKFKDRTTGEELTEEYIQVHTPQESGEDSAQENEE